MRAVHFISGLPRSGSTPLAGVLRQDPPFYAGMTGPVGGLFNVLQGELSGRNEYWVLIVDAQRRRTLEALFDGYCGEEFTADVVFDTNRIRRGQLRLLQEWYPTARVIACVRRMPWVIDGIEQLVCMNAFQPSPIFDYQPGAAVYSRAVVLANGEGMVGFAYNALKEAYCCEDTGDLILLQYETLVNNPAKAVEAVYEFIGELAFARNFGNVSFNADEFDARAGTPGLHSVGCKIEVGERVSVLPPDVFRRFENDAFWRDSSLAPRAARVV